MSDRLANKVAIVTGAARGQGEAEARLFAAEGARVMVTDVLDAEGEAVAADIGDTARYAHLDVSDEANWQAVVQATEDAFGPVSILVNNAGILSFGSIASTDVASYRKVLDVNLVGTLIGIKSVIGSMKAAGGGSIVNISSTGGLTGLPMLAAYVSSKWGVRGLTKTAALELGRSGIRVNSVHPGGIDTPMTRMPGMVDDEMSVYYSRLPIKRIGTVDDVASMVCFLASDESSYCTGGEFAVDGGATAGDASLLDTR
ncbi:glucose 1-dehydrogenase [soil metagenome]